MSSSSAAAAPPSRCAKCRSHPRRAAGNGRLACGLGIAAKSLQTHRRLALVARLQAYAQQRGGGIEQATDRGRRGGIQAALPGGMQQQRRMPRQLRIARRAHAGHGSPLSQLRLSAVRQGSRAARSPPGKRNGRQARDALPGAGPPQQGLPAPQRAVRAEADAIPGEAQQRRLAWILSRHGGGMRPMVPNGAASAAPTRAPSGCWESPGCASCAMRSARTP